MKFVLVGTSAKCATRGTPFVQGSENEVCRVEGRAAVIWEPVEWAEREFSECNLGDQRRNKRLLKLAVQTAARPDEGTPGQTESWSGLKGAYRLFNTQDVSFQKIVAPHCRHTREAGQAGEVKLIINDTTELNYTSHRAAKGLGAVGNGGKHKGFFVHSGLLLDAATEEIEGLAGQELFYRPLHRKKQGDSNSRRRDPKRESAVWGRLIDRIGKPPQNVQWLHVCDRGADDFEVMLRARRQACGFVIRASKLNRKVLTLTGRNLNLDEAVREWKSQGERQIAVAATAKQPARVARVELRLGEVLPPLPNVTNVWIRKHAGPEPMRLCVVELREPSPPERCEADSLGDLHHGSSRQRGECPADHSLL